MTTTDEIVGTLFNGLAVPRADGTAANLSAFFARDPWQRERYEALLPALLATMGLAGRPERSSYWEESPRGHAKTSDIAVLATFALVFATRPIRIVVAAADRDQAALVRNAIALLVRTNPGIDWSRKDADGKRTGWLDVQEARVVNKAENLASAGSTLEIISSDVASSWGTLADVIVLDEVTAWPVKGEGLWSSLYSAAAKKPNCALVCISNAGWRETWQWALRERIRVDPAWTFRRIEEPCASWITPETLAEQARILPPTVYARVWRNVWSSGSGDAIAEDLVLAALTQSGPMAWEEGWQFVAGLDVGLTRDACGLVVIGRHVGWTERRPRAGKRYHPTFLAMVEAGLAEAPRVEEDVIRHPATGRTRLASVRVWRPAPGRPVQLEEVEGAILDANRRYLLAAVGYDPWQAAYLAERLAKGGIGAVPVDPVPGNLKAIAAAMMEVFSEHQFDLFPDPDLLRDIRGLRLVERAYGVRLESPRGPSGHGDAASALGNALLVSKRLDVAAPREVQGELVCWPA